MKIQFQNKVESNKQQLIQFLELSKSERIYNFLNLMQKINQYPTKVKRVANPSNFMIEIETKTIL
ncbi:MAG: hypothetical protein V4548_01935 [Bacteroidota bacterium]